MQKILFIFICIAFISQGIHAESVNTGVATVKGETLGCASFRGPTTLTDVVARSLEVLGPLEFHNLEVQKETNITGPISASDKGNFNILSIVGPFEATDVTCTQLNAAGPMTVKNLTVKKTAIIGGPLEAIQSHFDTLIISANEIILKNTDIKGNIIVQNDKNKKQVLRLQGNTDVQGTITFESGIGTIEQGPNAKVKGKITGATVETK